MLVLPSVGASVKKIVLNESATKAKIYYDDGSTTIVSTKNTPTTQTVKKQTVTPHGVKVVKKNVVTKENVGFKAISTPNGKVKVPVNMESVQPSAMAQRAPDVIARAKKRAEMLESKTMDASAIAAEAMSEGQAVEMT